MRLTAAERKLLARALTDAVAGDRAEAVCSARRHVRVDGVGPITTFEHLARLDDALILRLPMVAAHRLFVTRVNKLRAKLGIKETK